MAGSEDITDFEVIENQKENIQSLPGGRSARKLAGLFSSSPLHKLSTPTPTDTRNLNDAIRAEFEAEIENISESDDPLDVFDRYVRWAIDAYPSAQATAESQLHTILERATKAFITSSQYKNDPRYLKLWMYYIQLFSDTPRETFLFLSRHGIGESLALYYEEYAAWLEGAGRWAQAEEVYKLGIEREARPVQRLLRKFKEFGERLAQHPDALAEPSSPALPTVRPALASKTDPFASSSHPVDPQAPRQTSGIGGSSSRPAKSKMAIFSDADAQQPALSSRDAASKGWDSIGSLADRKKENTMEPKPWVGETLKAGGRKPAAGGAKLAVFRDPSLAQIQNIVVVPSKHQVTVHPQTGKREHIFVDLAAVYPTPEEPGTELSFEEIIAAHRGWLDRVWDTDMATENYTSDRMVPLRDAHHLTQTTTDQLVTHQDYDPMDIDENGVAQEKPREPRAGRRKKIMEVNETQIIKAKLDSPSGPKFCKKKAAEPTMTIHTKAATDDIYEIFNAPLKPAPVEGDEAGDDYDDDDDEDEDDDDDDDGDEDEIVTDADFASDVESTGTTRQIQQDEVSHNLDGDAEEAFSQDEEMEPPRTRTIFIPLPPEDYEPPTRPYRDAATMANNRLPFMTPITERTEYSMDVDMDRAYQFKTPSKRDGRATSIEEALDSESSGSPLREFFPEESPFVKGREPLGSKAAKALSKTGPNRGVPVKGPVVKEAQCSPIDDNIRRTILTNMQPPLAAYPGFYDHHNQRYERGGEIRRFAKAVSRLGKANPDRAGHGIAPVVIRFADCQSRYTVKRELGAGAFAPVYLVENSDPDQDDNRVMMGRGPFAVSHRAAVEALKMESPPTPWEFYIMRTAHTRLGPQHRATASISLAHEMHLYQDEAFLFLPFHPHGTLLDVINIFRAEPSGVMDEQLAMFFAIEIFRTVEALHSKGVLHGDLKPDNCLLRLDAKSAFFSSDQGLSSKWHADGSGGWGSRGVVLIDFGRGIDMKAFVPDVQFVADWKTTAQDCPEMREGRPWTWQIDYYGLAGVIHCLLFGKYLETVRADQGGLGRGGRRYRIRESLKRYWQTDIWADCFEVLLNPASFVAHEDGGRMPVLRSMRSIRERMEAWLEENCERGAGLKALMGRVEAFVKSRR
ncbi:Checkpoint serine/threonine-protein kinase BUB1 [Trichoderma ghanense]|uniref:Checkpoint serine/threonine-protein kinase BUB1 n=1 Tax=Trichoderma ghanense TaxID=65468 RepID=A0ABY2HCD4_9HYPO